MSINVEGQKCPVCKGYLFNDDDIVWCPECGAAHHRDCYKAKGTCGYFEIHGTEELDCILNQQSRQKQEQEQSKQEQNFDFNQVGQIRCPSCSAMYPADAKACPNCAAPNFAQRKNVYVFDMLGGVNPNEDLGDGVTADKAKNFVMVSTNRFIPKFLAFKRGKKCFFNWFALLFPSAAFASRKMYPAAFISGVVQVCASLLTVPFALQVSKLGLETYSDYSAFLANGMPKEFMQSFTLALVGSLFALILSLICALTFDKIYYKHVIKKVKEIEKTAAQKEEKIFAYRKQGGFNLFSMLLAFVILRNLPGIIATFIL